MLNTDLAPSLDLHDLVLQVKFLPSKCKIILYESTVR
jgi:hypothetical protein